MKVRNDIKQVILVRNDLNMSPGKAAAQVGHASMLFLADYIRKGIEGKDNHFLLRELQWIFNNGPIRADRGIASYGGMKKIVLGVDDLNSLEYFRQYADMLGIKTFNVYDEGLDAITCCAIGPDYSDDIDKVTGHLKLYGDNRKRDRLGNLYSVNIDLSTPTSWYTDEYYDT